MSKINYPDDWLGQESTGLVINYAELSKLVKANSLDSGHLSYLIQSIQDNVLCNINRMIATQPKEELGK
jgi:hypothetical protein